MISSEISIALELHGISHVVSTGCTSSTDAIGYAAALIRERRSGRDPVRRRGRLRHAGHDLRLLEDARVVDASTTTRPAGVTAVRSRPRRLRARRGRVDVGARARGPRPRPRRARSTRRSTAMARPATPITACRWIPTASRSSARCGWRSSARAARSRRSATSTITARRRAQRRGRSAVRAPAVRRRADRSPGSSTKSMIGHPQGASGAAGIVTTALALANGFLPPTINQRRTGSRVRSRLIPNMRPPGRRSSAALCNCLGFGSKNSAIVLGSCRTRRPADRR